MAGIDIEVIGKTYYTVHLTDDDIKLVKDWMKNNFMYFPSFDMRDNIVFAIYNLARAGKIDLYSDDKATELKFETEEVNWSKHEDRSVEEILGEV